MREAMPVEPMQSTSHAVPSRGPLEQPHGRLGLSRVQAAEYIGVGFSLFDQTVADDQHAAAIEMAISVALLPRGTAIILQTAHTIWGRIYWSAGLPRPIIRSSRWSMVKRWSSPTIS